MRDQLAQVARQNAARIMRRLVRLAAQPVGAQVGHDHPEALAPRSRSAWPNLIQFIWRRRTGRGAG